MSSLKTKITISTECGHSFKISPENTLRWKEELDRLYTEAIGASGATFDCKVCNQLCIIVLTVDGHFGRLFHHYMHEQDSRWPIDGSNTFSF